MTAKRDGTHHYFNLCQKDRFSSGFGAWDAAPAAPKYSCFAHRSRARPVA